jgi:hypothetical protein
MTGKCSHGNTQEDLNDHQCHCENFLFHSSVTSKQHEVDKIINYRYYSTTVKETEEYTVKTHHVVSANQKKQSAFIFCMTWRHILTKNVIWLFINDVRYIQR